MKASGRLAIAAGRCDGLRKLTTGSVQQTAAASSQPVLNRILGQPRIRMVQTRVVSLLVQQCAQTEAIDGFLYNSCILAIDRALSHKKRFYDAMQIQARLTQASPTDTGTSFDAHLVNQSTYLPNACVQIDDSECHIEVLIRSANAIAMEHM